MFHDYDTEHIQTESPKLLKEAVGWLREYSEHMYTERLESHDRLDDLIQTIDELLDLIEKKTE